MNSRLSVLIDGDKRAEWALDGPLLAYDAGAGWDIWFNRGHDEPEASCDWALGHFAIQSPPTDGYAEATALLEHREMVASLEMYRCMSSSQHLRQSADGQRPLGAAEPINIQEWLADDEDGEAGEVDRAPHIT
jgi:hypothetical protein